MKGKNLSSVFRSFLALILALVMALSMSVFVYADEEAEEEDAATEEGTENTEEEQADDSNYVPAETVTPEGYDGETEVSQVGFYRDGRYVDYYNEHKADDKALPTIVIEGSQITSATAPYRLAVAGTDDQKLKERDTILIMDKEGALTYNVTVAETGMYMLGLDYFPLLGDGNGKDIELGVKVDGAYPHNDANRFSLKRNWTDESDEKPFDSIGNELYSKQVEYAKWLSKDVRDPDGVFDDGVMFYLTAGAHTLTLEFIAGYVALDKVTLHNNGGGISYLDYLTACDAEGAADVDVSFELETEDYIDKSESLIQPAYDRSDPKVSPYSISKTRLNVLGGESWNTNGQIVNWKITVPEDGYYTFGIRYRQSYVEDSVSYRRLYIDGEVPFAEANELGFPFGIGYHYTVLSDENGDAYKFYLTAGDHELSMEAVIGPMADIGRKAEDIVYQMNYIYRKIIIVTGTTPDTYRD